jgi:hypothetical protein
VHAVAPGLQDTRVAAHGHPGGGRVAAVPQQLVQPRGRPRKSAVGLPVAAGDLRRQRPIGGQLDQPGRRVSSLIGRHHLQDPVRPGEPTWRAVTAPGGRSSRRGQDQPRSASAPGQRARLVRLVLRMLLRDIPARPPVHVAGVPE